MLIIEDIHRLFKSAPLAPRIEDSDDVRRIYRQWRIRMMYATFIGYAITYFCRKNISIALPAIGVNLGLSNAELGIFGSALYVTYGVGRFVNGVFADKSNPRYFMSMGLIMSAVMNILFGLSSSFWCLTLFWGLNGWFQSMCFPPCSKVLANWYSVSERATKWAVWHVSHQIGGFIIAIFAGFLVQNHGWRAGFYVPAVICFATTFFLLNRLRDTPPSLGLPDIATYRGDIERNRDGSAVDESHESIGYTLLHRVLNNRHIWLVGFMTLFVYILRCGVFDWATKFLVEVKGSSIIKGGIVVSMIELVGIFGSLAAGVISDRWYHGRRAPWCAISFALALIGLGAFYFIPGGHSYLDAGALAVVGFFVYGPQFLQGPFAADLASRKAAATANGLTGAFGYFGATLSGFVTGICIDAFGWGGGFAFWALAAVLGILTSLILWNVRAGSAAEKHRVRSELQSPTTLGQGLEAGAT